MRHLLCGAALALAPLTPAAAQADAWWGHVKTLAHDSMRGRETGSAEHRRAAEYVAAAFERAGLKPAGTDGWLQPVRFRVRRIVESGSSLAIVRDGKTEPLELGPDAAIGVRTSEAGTIEAPLVFAGYGIRVPEYRHDDLAGLDLNGKIAVVLAGGAPTGIPGPALANARATLGETLRAAGAVGVVAIANPRGDVPWSRATLARLNPQMVLLDTVAGSRRAPPLAVTVSSESAERLFAGSGRTYAELQALADSGAPLPRLELPLRLRATVAVEERETVSDNVVGLLPGADSVLGSEYLVLTAHLDHVGVGRPVDGDSIYNGAMDNASGIATMIETARALTGRPVPLRRSVLFVAVTGEEKGLLGSDYFAGHPTVPAGAIVADLNTDMFLPINPLRHLLVNGLEESDLADDVRRAAAKVGVEVVTDPEPERNAFIRSDQYSFIRRGIPALSLKVGYLKGSPEHERVLRWRQERYHGPKDDLTQPVNLEAAVEFNRLYAELVTEAANRATRPAWNATSIFRRRAEGTP